MSWDERRRGKLQVHRTVLQTPIRRGLEVLPVVWVFRAKDQGTQGIPALATSGLWRMLLAWHGRQMRWPAGCWYASVALLHAGGQPVVV